MGQTPITLCVLAGNYVHLFSYKKVVGKMTLPRLVFKPSFFFQKKEVLSYRDNEQLGGQFLTHKLYRSLASLD